MKNMFRIENLNTGEWRVLVAGGRKEAHEFSQSLWPNVVTQVQTLQEFRDTNIWHRHNNAAMSFTQDAYEMIGTQRDAEIVACLNRAMNELEALRDHFADRLPGDPNGTDSERPTNGNPTVH